MPVMMMSLMTPKEAAQTLGVPASTLRYRATQYLKTPEGKAMLSKFGPGFWIAPISVWEYLAKTDWRTRGQRIRRGRPFPDVASNPVLR